jgi:peptidoglycan-N-acetylglucosamine deacetylase
MLRIVIALFVVGAAGSYAYATDYDCAYDPKTSHLSRIIAADSTNGPIYGTALNDPGDKPQVRTLDLRDHEIVLTFDDGPLGGNTQTVIDTLQKHCVKATFFSVGRMAQANPKLLQEVERRGHTIGTHTWSHPRAMDTLTPEDIKLEIEKGFVAVSQALGKPIAPFFRFPGLRDSTVALKYLSGRNISVWSVDVISGDTDPGASVQRVSHDVVARKKHTAEALDGILTEWEKEGYKFVHVVSNTNYQPDPELLARTDVFRNTPETATITGHWLASAREQLKDGSVDFMHTEWIDLKRASDRLAGQPAGDTPAPKPRAEAPRSDIKQNTAWSTSSWLTGQVR